MADNNSDSGIWLLIFSIAAIGLIVWGVWTAFKPQITSTIITTRAVQMNVASLWTPDDKIIDVPMPYSQDDDKPLQAKMGDNEQVVYMPAQFGLWRKIANDRTRETIREGEMRVMTYIALRVWRIPLCLILGAFILWIIFSGPTSRFHRTLSIESLLSDQARTFAILRPFIKFNPSTLPVRPPGAPVPADLPMFAEALGPEEWLAFNEIPMPDGKPDRTAVEAAFAKQLGPRWKGPLSLPPELQILLAAFCLKAARKRDEAEQMLGRLACCWDHKSGLRLSRERGLLSSARKVLKNKSISERTLANCNRHAYVTTAMLRALDTARSEGGVLAPAQFVWLRAHNRALWYPLNNLGRTAFHAEALGAASHYRSEKQVGRPIPTPRMADAYEGLMSHMTNPTFVRPIPEVDYSGSRKKTNKNTGIMKPVSAA